MPSPTRSAIPTSGATTPSSPSSPTMPSATNSAPTPSRTIASSTRSASPSTSGEWGMSPPTVNAYYDDSMNDINFPAGILQPPFFDRTQDDAVNYGHIGAVIGHELTHGFDDEGRKFDAKGNLSDWWTPEDLKKFEARTDCLVNEYGTLHRGRRRQGQRQAYPRRKYRRQRRPAARVHGLHAASQRGPHRHNAKIDGFTGRSGSTSPSRRTGARTRAPKHARAGADRSALARPHPRRRRDCQSARFRRRLRLQETQPHGSRQQLPRLVAGGCIREGVE